jgi:hypothetical protein
MWPTLGQNWYQALPLYMAAFQTERQKKKAIFQNLVPGRFPWSPNMGPVQRRIAQEMPPVIRQGASPRLINQVPLYDITATRERYNDVYVYRHRFQSPIFNFYPEWTDFKKHVDINMEAVQDMVDIYYDLFIRERMIAYAPYVYVAGVGLVTGVPTGFTQDGSGNWSSKKTLTWWSAQTNNPQITDLSLAEVFKALNAAESQIGMTPFSGSGLPSGDSKPLDSKFALVLGSERWNQFVNDPWTKENRPINMNIITDTFKGDLWGRVTCKLEPRPYRLLQAAGGTLTEPAPEQWAIDPDRPENNSRPQPNPDYATNAQYEVSLLIGGKFGSRMDVGAPPSAFTGSVGGVKGMTWNGKAYITNKFLIPGVDQAGNRVNQLAEQWGEDLIVQAQLALGYAPDNAFNVLPIISKRLVGVTTTGATA